MKKKTVISISLILILVLSACSSKAVEVKEISESVAPTAAIENLDYLPEHAPETSPIIITEPAKHDYKLSGHSSFERPREGCFTFCTQWEYEMFKGQEPSDGLQHPYYVAPYEQDKPYDFRIDKLEITFSESAAMEIAETFSQLGFKSRVKSETLIESGQECTSYIAIVTMSPNEMWELSKTMEGDFLVEQLYPGVDLRFDKVVWEG